MKTIGKVTLEFSVVEMLVCTQCESTRDPEDYGLCLKTCRRDDCGQSAAVDPDDRECPNCNKQSLGKKEADWGCEDCNSEMEVLPVIVCDHCGERLKLSCGRCHEDIVLPEPPSS